MSENNGDDLRGISIEEVEVREVPVPTESKPIVSLPVSILAAAILVSGSIIYSAGQKGVVPAPAAGDLAPAAARGEVPPISDRDVFMGDKSAPVTFIEYGDYQCPFCGRFFSSVEPDLIRDYVSTGKVKFIYRDLAFLGPESTAAAEAAECSKDQGKFWQFHDALYTEEIKDGEEHNNNLNRDLFVKLSRQVGMDQAEFIKCYDGKKYAPTVAETVRAAQAAGINSTPTSFVNGQEVLGAQPYASFAGMIDALLNQ